MILLVSTSSQRSWWYFSLCSSPGILQDSGGCLASFRMKDCHGKREHFNAMPFGISPFCPNLSFTTIRHFEMFQHVNKFGILRWGQRMVSTTGATTLRAAFWGENCKSFCRWNSASVVVTESWGPACRCQGGAAFWRFWPWSNWELRVDCHIRPADLSGIYWLGVYQATLLYWKFEARHDTFHMPWLGIKTIKTWIFPLFRLFSPLCNPFPQFVFFKLDQWIPWSFRF